MTKHVLVVDDDANLGAVLEAELTKRDFQVTLLQSPEEAISRIETGGDVDVVLTDFQMQGATGAELCARVGDMDSEIPVIVMTSFGSVDTAIASIRAGAYDFVTKPFEPDDLATTLDRGVKEHVVREEMRRLRNGVDDAPRFADMVGDSPEMVKAFELIDRVASSEATVLVTGESGTGKELVAKAIHSRSARAEGPFIAINCAAMPEPLLESELFGHAKGAFTDARQSRPGVFLKATGGTLFLDEIGEMPAGMQVKLLRAIQERTVRPVGGDEEIEFDTRIVAATTWRDLEREVAEGRFRADLYYRINVVCVELPPLRARGRDILTLATHILARCQPNGQRVIGFTAGVVDAMLSYSWPGNVRELQNTLERAVALALFDHLRLEDLPDKMRSTVANAETEGGDPQQLITAAELERRYISHVMATVNGNKTVAARILGLDRRTVYRKMCPTPPEATPER